MDDYSTVSHDSDSMGGGMTNTGMGEEKQVMFDDTRIRVAKLQPRLFTESRKLTLAMSNDGDRPLRVDPGEIRFESIEPGVLYVMSFSVRNCTRAAQRIRIRAPRSGYFALNYIPAGVIAPGIDVRAEIECQLPTTGIDLRFLDSIVVTMGQHSLEVPLSATKPSAVIKFDPLCNLGYVAEGQFTSVNVQLENTGQVASTIVFKPPAESRIKISPLKLELAARGGRGAVQVSFESRELGPWREFVQVNGSGTIDPGILDVTVQVVDQKLNLLAANNGGIMDQVDFGALFYGEQKIINALLVNTGPQQLSFSIVYDDEVGGLGGAGGSTTNPQTEDGSAQVVPPLEKLMVILPAQGLIKPFSQVPVKIKFSPLLPSPVKGFVNEFMLEAKEVKFATRRAMINCPEMGQRISMNMQGSASTPSVVVTPTLLRFGACAVNDRRDILVTLVNKSASVTAFDFSKLAHFKVSIESGKLQPFQTASVIFSFTPTQLGVFKNVIKLTLAGGLSTIDLKVLAEADQTGKKVMVGGVGAMPEDFQRQLKFVDPEEISALRQAKKEGRRMLSGTNAAPFHPLQDDRTFFSNSSSKQRDEIYALDKPLDELDLSNEHPFKLRQEHNKTYNQYLQRSHTTRLESKRDVARRRLVQRGAPDRNDPFGVDMGMERGLEEPDLKVPSAGEPLWLKNRTDGAGGGTRSRIPTDENRLIQKKYPSVAATAAEMRDCSAEISLEDLGSILASHKTVDFGKVCVGSLTAKSFCITNEFSQSVFIKVEGFEVESKLSKPEAQIVPPGAVAGFDIYFTSKMLGKYKKTFSYKVNGHYSYKINVVAEVVPIELEMNKSELIMEFPDDSIEPSLSQDLFLKNPGNAVADFLWGSSGAFVCKPDKGSINPGQVAIISIVWTPAAEKRNKEELALNITGGIDKTITVTGIIKEVKAAFEEKKLSLGLIAVGSETKVKATIKNSGNNSAVFFVDTLDDRLGVRVIPEKGIIPPGESIKLDVIVVPKSAMNYDSSLLSVSIRGGKPINIKFAGESVVPALEMKETEFSMGSVAVGSEFRLPMTISNRATISACLILDLTNYPDFKPSIQRPDVYAEITSEQSDASNNTIILVKPADDGSDGSLSPNSAKKLNLWKIRVNPGATLHGSLVLLPTFKKKYAFKLPLHLQGLGNVNTFAVDVSGEALVSKLAISAQMVDFGDRIVSRDPLARATYFLEVSFRSLDSTKGFSYEIKDSPEDAAQAAAAAEQGVPPTFFISPVRGDLAPNQSAPIRVTFQPQASGGFTKRLQIFVSGQPDPDRPYYTLLCRGSGVYPRMTFSKTNLQLPVVPLGTTTRATVTIFNNGYGSLAIKHKVSPAITVPLDVAFPDGNEFGITTDRIRVVISTKVSAPSSWSGKIEFLDNDGERFVINVSGCSDNSLITNFPFVKQYSNDYGFLGLDSQAVQFMRKSDIAELRAQDQRRKEQLRKQRALERQGKANNGSISSSDTSKKKKVKDEPSVADDTVVRVDDTIEGVDPDREVDVSDDSFDLNEIILVLKWLNRNICRIPFDDERFPGCITDTYGDIVVDCIEQLSGKKIAGIKPGTEEPEPPSSGIPGSRRSERPDSSQISPANAKLAVVNRLVAKYQTIISYLVRAGALLSHINPMALLSLDDHMIAQEQELKRVEGNRFTRNVLADNQESWRSAWLLNCKNGWMEVLFQSIKVFALSRVTYAGYTTMPGVMLASSEEELPPAPDGKGAKGGKGGKKGPQVPVEFSKSNVYSQSECVLLAWLSYHVHHAGNLHDDGAEKTSERLVGLNKRICDFDADLCALYPFLQIMHSHLPESTKHGGPLYGYTALDRKKSDDMFARLMEVLERCRMSFDFAEDELVSSGRTLLLLALHLFLNLPSLLPKAKVEFKGVVGSSITKTIELKNPSKKKVVYNVTLQGSTDFSVLTKELVLLPESSADFQVTLKARFFEPVSATITFWGVRDAGVAGSTMVFQLVSCMTGRKPEQSVKCSAHLFDMESVQITFANPFPKDSSAIPIRILHHHAPLGVEDALKGNPVNPKLRGIPGGSVLSGDNALVAGTGGSKGAPVDEEKEMERMFRNPFWACEDTVQLNAGYNKTLHINFLPFLMGVHTCHVILLDPTQGEVCLEIVLEVSLPRASEKLDFAALRDGSTTQKMLRFSSKNVLFEKALSYVTDVRLTNPSKKAKARSVISSLIASSVEDDTTGATTYIVDVLSPFFSAPKTIAFISEYLQLGGGAATTTPGGRPDTQGNKFKKVQRTSLDVMSPQDVTSPGFNGAVLSFNPDRAGTYQAQLAIYSKSNKSDLRMLDLQVAVTMPDAKIVLEFKGPARQKLSQEIPIQNTSGRDWNLQATVAGKGFAGPKSLVVPRGDKAAYVLTFTGPYAGSFEGTLSLKSDGGEHNDHFDYNLVGVADEPLAEDHLQFKCKARTRTTLSIPLQAVQRPSGAALTKADKRGGGTTSTGGAASGGGVFDVQTDLPYVTGDAQIEIGSNGATYEFSIMCPVGGVMSGSISFTDPNSGAIIWYTVDVEVTAPMPESTIEVTSMVRKAVAVEISLENPTKDTLVFNVTTEGEGLLGDATYSLPAGQSSSFYELIYSPLLDGEFVGRISFFNERVGEFWYRLHMVATAAPPTIVDTVECMVGDTKTIAVAIENPLGEEVTLDVSSSDPDHFFVAGDQVVLGPYSQSTFPLQFRPSSLTDVAYAQLVLTHSDFGALQYNVSGKGQLPGVMPLARVFSPLNEVSSYTIAFRNPFPNALPVDVILSEEAADGSSGAFSLLLRKTGDLVIPAKAPLQISVGFCPQRLGEYSATVNIRSNISGRSLLWCFPIVGMAEAGSPQILEPVRTPCKTSILKDVDVYLKGLRLADLKPGEVVSASEFSLELIVANEKSKPLVARSFRAQQIELVTLPETSSLHGTDFMLRYRLLFEPLRTFSASIEMLLESKNRGRWRLEVDVEGTDPEPDDIISLTAPVGGTDKVSFRLSNRFLGFSGFQAYFSAKSSPHFSVSPTSGVLAPYGSDGSTFVVSFSPATYGLREVGYLTIQTEDAEWSYLCQGEYPELVIDKANLVSKVDSRR